MSLEITDLTKLNLMPIISKKAKWTLFEILPLMSTTLSLMAFIPYLHEVKPEPDKKSSNMKSDMPFYFFFNN